MRRAARAEAGADHDRGVGAAPGESGDDARAPYRVGVLITARAGTTGELATSG
jgi:hypothetical protein